MRTSIGLAAVVALLPFAALAQGGGRTDGPEGSEVGKGGYSRAAGGATAFSLSAHWGAAITKDAPDSPPLFAGGAADFWLEDWIQLELSGAYLWDTRRGQVMVGPRVRTLAWPIALTGAIEAGPMFFQGGPGQGTQTRFGLSPTVGAEMTFGHLLTGLHYAVDFAIADNAPNPSQRVYLALGWKF